MPRNKTSSLLWPKDPAYYGQMRNQVCEKEGERRDGYSLREQKVVEYKEKEETYINDSEDATADEKKQGEGQTLFDLPCVLVQLGRGESGGFISWLWAPCGC